MRTLAALVIVLSLGCSGESVQYQRRELCRQLCESWRCNGDAGPASADDSCVQSCYNTSDPGAAGCLTHLEAWLQCSRKQGPICTMGQADVCIRERCAAAACDSCRGCRVTCPSPNSCSGENGSLIVCE